MRDVRRRLIARLMCCFALILTTMTFSEGTAQESSQKFEGLVYEGCQWNAKKGIFLTRGDKQVTMDDFAKLIGAKPGGVVDHMDNEKPWLLLDNSPWMLKSNTVLQFCPECYGSTFFWNPASGKFENTDPVGFSANDVNSMLDDKLGGWYKYREREYPWVTLGDSQWVVGPNGLLYYCPTCAGTGNPGPSPPWGGNQNGPEVVVVSQSGADDGSFIVEASRNVYTSCRALYYDDRNRSPWDECKK